MLIASPESHVARIALLRRAATCKPRRMKRLGVLALLPLIVACDNSPKAKNYTVVLEDAGGLKTGANVYIAGVQVGRVNQVDLDGDKARVQFDLRNARGFKVTASTCVGVGWYGLGSDTHLSVEPGKVEAATIAPGGEISCARGAFSKKGEAAMASAEKLLSTALSGKGLVSRLLHDKELADKVERFFDSPSPSPSAAPSASAPPEPVAPVPIAKPPKSPPPPAMVAPLPKPKPKPKKPKSDLVNPFE